MKQLILIRAYKNCQNTQNTEKLKQYFRNIYELKEKLDSMDQSLTYSLLQYFLPLQIFNEFSLNPKHFPIYRQQYIQKINNDSHINLEILELSQQQVNITIDGIVDGEIILMNPQCANCSPLFYQNHYVMNKKCNCANVVGISGTQFYIKDQLMRNIIALANLIGGGVLVVGTELNDQRKILGMKMTKKQIYESNEYLEDIKKQILKINEHLLITWQVLNVYRSYLNFSQEQYELKYCFRIQVIPLEAKMSYHELSNKGFHKLYDFVIYESAINQQGKKYMSLKEIKYPKTSMIIQYMKQTKLSQGRVNLHLKDTCSCEEPLPLEFKQQLIISNSKVKINLQDQKFLQANQPKFKHANCSMILVASQKKKILITKFYEQLIKQKRETVDLERPFYQIIGKGGPLIFIISYAMSFPKFKDYHEKFDKNKLMIVLPVSNVITVVENDHNKHHKHLALQLEKWYPDQVKINVTKQKHVQYWSQNIKAILFSYCWFQNKSVRPYMAKQCKK